MSNLSENSVANLSNGTGAESSPVSKTGRSLLIPNYEMQGALWGTGGGLMLGPGLYFLWLLLTVGGPDGPVILGLIGLIGLLIGYGVRLLGERQGMLIDLDTASIAKYTGWQGNAVTPLLPLSEISGIAVRYDRYPPFDDSPRYFIELVKTDGSRMNVGERRLKFFAVRLTRKIAQGTGLPLLMEC